MKTIGYYDRADGDRRIKRYMPIKPAWLSRNNRIASAFTELVGMGNIVIVLINGNNVRKIAVRGF